MREVLRLVKLIPQTGTIRSTEDLNPATRTAGRFQSLNQRIMFIKRVIHVMQRQWLQPLNRSLENFLKRLFRTSERNEKPRRVFKKPRCNKDASDNCIDNWIEVLKLHFEGEDLTERQECSALTSNFEGTALNCVMAKSNTSGTQPRKSLRNPVESFWLRGFKDTKREDETIDDLVMLKRRSQPEESNSSMKLAVALKFKDDV